MGFGISRNIQDGENLHPFHQRWDDKISPYIVELFVKNAHLFDDDYDPDRVERKILRYIQMYREDIDLYDFNVWYDDLEQLAKEDLSASQMTIVHNIAKEVDKYLTGGKVEEKQIRKAEEAERRRVEAERKAKEEANRKAKEAEKTKLRAESKRQDSTIWPKVQSNESIDLPIYKLAFSWGLPIAVVLGGWIWSLFDDDSHGLGFYLSMFLLTAIITNFVVAIDKDLDKGQKKYFVIPLIILILISGIWIWLAIRSSMNQPATKETYTYINDRFLVKNVFIVEINDGDTLLNLKNQGLCEFVDDHLYERIKPKYDSIGYFAQTTNDVEMFIIKQDGKYGLVDKEDEELVKPKYTRIEMSDEDLKTQDGIKLFKAYTDNTVDVYSYEPRYYGQLQDK